MTTGPEAEVDQLLARPARPLDGLSAAGWEALLDAAYRHGALGAVAGRLPPDDAEVRTRFERLAAAVRIQDGRLRAALEAAAAALNRRGIVAGVLKGPVLADRIHPDPGLRPAGDLDLLVAERQLPEATEALVAEGYRVLAERYERRHSHHLSLVHPARPPVELHDRPESGFAARLSGEDVLSRASPRFLPGGAEVRVLAPADELVALCVHAAGHLFQRRGWVYDLLLFLEAHPALEWREVEERARRARCRPAVAYALREVRGLGGRVPHGLVAAAGPLRATLADRLRRAALARGGRDRLVLGLRLAYDVVLCDGASVSSRRAADHVVGFLRRSAYRALHRSPTT